MAEHFNCPACGSADTVNCWDKKPVSDGPLKSVDLALQAIYPDARTCVDCGWTQPTKPRPKLDLSKLTVTRRDWRPIDD